VSCRIYAFQCVLVKLMQVVNRQGCVTYNQDNPLDEDRQNGFSRDGFKQYWTWKGKRINPTKEEDI
jgi:hypothetical protein